MGGSDTAGICGAGPSAAKSQDAHRPSQSPTHSVTPALPGLDPSSMGAAAAGKAERHSRKTAHRVQEASFRIASLLPPTRVLAPPLWRPGPRRNMYSCRPYLRPYQDFPRSEKKSALEARIYRWAPPTLSREGSPIRMPRPLRPMTQGWIRPKQISFPVKSYRPRAQARLLEPSPSPADETPLAHRLGPSAPGWGRLGVIDAFPGLG